MVPFTIEKSIKFTAETLGVGKRILHRRSQDFGFGGRGANRKSHAMTSSRIFKKREFSWTKNERSEAGVCVFGRYPGFLLKGKDLNYKLKCFREISKLGKREEQISVTQTCHSRVSGSESPSRQRLWGSGGKAPNRWAIFLQVFGKYSYHNAIRITFRAFSRAI